MRFPKLSSIIAVIFVAILITWVTKAHSDERMIEVPALLLQRIFERNAQLTQENAEYEVLLEKAADKIEQLQKKTNCV